MIPTSRGRMLKRGWAAILVAVCLLAAGASVTRAVPGESAWDVFRRENPAAVAEGLISPFEARVLAAMTPAQADAYAEGADPATIVLESGETLAQHIAFLLAGGDGLVYVPLDSCRLFDTALSAGGAMAAGETRAFFAKGADLSAQGGSATGCDVPAEAAAAVIHFQIDALTFGAEARLRVGPVGAVAFATIVAEYEQTPDRSLFSRVSVVTLCSAGCGAGDFEVTTVGSSTQVAGDVVGYFRPIVVGDLPGGGIDADTLDGIDSTGFALDPHTHAGEDVTTGTVGEPRIDSAAARDSEVFGIVLGSDGSGSTLDADTLDGKQLSAFRPRPQNVILVCASGCDFSTIQAALDAIGTTFPAASATNRYLVRVGAGDFAEQVTMKPFVDIEGKGKKVTKIIAAQSGALVLGADDAELRQLTVMNLGGGTQSTAIGNVNVAPMITHVDAKAQGGVSENIGILNDGAGATPALTHVLAYATVPTAFGVRNINGASPVIRDSVLSGATAAIRNEDTATAKIANTELMGDADFLAPALQSSYMCVRAFAAGTLTQLNGECNPNTPPTAVDDSYASLGNTLLEVTLDHAGAASAQNTTATQPSVIGETMTPKTYRSVFENDSDAETADKNLLTAAVVGGTVTAGAVVNMYTDGAFEYTPPVGFTGADTFDYTVTDPGGQSDTGTVTINVSNLIWFVDNDNAGTADGRSTTPYTTLAPIDTGGADDGKDGAGDTIFVFDGTGNTTGGILLETNQILHGHAIALQPAGFEYAGGGALVPATTRPTIIDGAGDVIVLATGNTVRGLNIAATNGRSVFGSGIAGSTFSQVGITGTGTGLGPRFDNATGTISVGDLDVNSSTGIGIDIQGGSATFTFDSLSSITNPAGAGINVNGGTTQVTFNGPITQNNAASAVRINNHGGTGAFTNTITANTGAANGIDLTSNTGSFTFSGALDIDTTTGTGFNATGGTVQVTNLGNFLDTTGSGASGIGINLGATIGGSGVTFNTVNVGSSGGAASGILLASTGAGSFTVGTGTIQNTNSRGFDAANVDGTVTIGASLENDGGRTVEINTGSTGSFTFSGAIDEDAQGIDISSNSGGTFTFQGGLDIDTTGSNTGLNATGGGTLNVCADDNCSTAGGNAVVNTVDVGAAKAVNIDSVNIGAEGVTFRSINSSGGADPGIDLNATGSVAGSFFSVTGTGGDCKAAVANCSGGSITSKTGVGVDVDGARDVRLAAMRVDGSGSHGIALDNVAGFIFDNSRLTGNGDAVGEQGLRARELSGTVNITNSFFQGNEEDHVEVLNETNATTSTVTVTGNTFDLNTAGPPGNNGINYASRGTVSKNITFDIRGNTFQNIRATAIQIDAERNTTHNITIGGPNAGDVNTFDNNNVAVNLTNNFSGDVIAVIENNTMTDHGSSGAGQVINLFTGTSASTGSSFKATVDNNRIGTMGVSNSGTPNGNAVRIISQGNTAFEALVENNMVYGVTNGGIEAQARDGVASLDVTLRNNNLNFEDSVGVFVAGTATAGETINLCADIGGPMTESNTIVNTELTAFFVFSGVSVQQSASGGGTSTFTLPNFGGGATAAVETFIDGQNTISTPGAAFAQNVFATGTFTAGGTQCSLP